MKKTILSVILILLAAVVARTEEVTGYAVVNLSVCNLRSTPDYSAEMVTQALMGTPVHILGKDGWYRIMTPDGYTGWVHPAGIRVMEKEEYSEWNRAEKAVITSLTGIVHERKTPYSPTVSDVVGGDRLRFLGKEGLYMKVGFPDGRTGYISRRDAKPEGKWRAELDNSAEAIIATARSMKGFPYLWAGTSPKGMDCSGFVRTVLYMHDIIIPRDASQQAPKGERIEIAEDFSNLVPGDLLFFGKTRVSHVAIYVGGKRFIHSLGWVVEASLDPESPDYDEYNTGRLLFAGRVLPYIDKEEGLETTPNNSFYSE